MGTGFITGAFSSYVGGKIDSQIMRIRKAFMTFPTFIPALFLIGVFGTGPTNVILAIVLTHCAWYARITRGMVMNPRRRKVVMVMRNPMSAFDPALSISYHFWETLSSHGITDKVEVR